MNRFEQKATPAIFTAIALSMVGVLIADYFTPLGIAVWIVYLIPVVLAFSVWRPIAPIVIASAASLLMVVTFLTDAPGADPVIARINRGFGLLTIWVMALVGYQFIRSRLAVRKQEWLQSGQTRLSAQMVGEQRPEELGQNVLSFLAEYLGAHAGAFFVATGDGFRRFATYAVPDGSGVPERFTVGDGLLGQAVKDRQTFIVRDVPPGYLTVGSALGQGRPVQLLIAPLSVDGIVNAVLELGFFHPIYEADSELLERVEEAIAVAVRSAQYRARLQELLEETQRQAEELQAQSEELRVSNEELEEQSRALQDSQVRLELQQAELEQTNTQLEDHSQRLEAQRDELRRAKAAVEAQARELRQASQYKSDFLANMSHELRTPLNSSLILARLLADNPAGNLSDEQVTYAETIHGAGNDLLALINDILDLSKIEAGRMEVRPEPVRVSQLLESLARTFRPVAVQKGLEYGAHTGPDAPEVLETDPQRLEQVLKNLIANALKFTEKGGIAVEVCAAPQGRVVFSVRDTGIGIPNEQQEVIFEAFRQADGTTNRKYGGTGLGLSISRELSRLLGGELAVESEVGRGSVFTVTLPQRYHPSLVRDTSLLPAVNLEAEATRPSARLVPSEHSSRNVRAPVAPVPPRAGQVEDDRERLTGNRRIALVVEDDEAFARILCDLANELNFQCLIANTADEALTLAAQFTPSAVILDIGLPDHTGLSVLDRLKHDARTRHIPVHVVSGSDYSQTALSLGAAGYVLKPVKREELVQTFQRLESQLTQKLRRVLVVEDDDVQLDSLQRLLASREVETVGVQTAAECLEQLKSTTFDCMVLDLSLPDASGFSLLETLSREDRYSFPPVIVYTGRDLSVDAEQQLRRYSKSIIIKGAKSPERLLDEVTLFLHQVVSELPVEQQRMLEKARSRDAALEGRRILVVEDDVRNVFALTSILEPRGAEVRIARNGREALESLDRSQGDPALAVDLVLMDIMMPEMDGLTATREIRKRPEWKKLPIIALTAKAMRESQEHCLEAGANDYMAKPVDVEKLLSLVRVWISR